MLPSSASDASICLRCHLRLALRRVASRPRPSFHQRRHQYSYSVQEQDREPDRDRDRDRRDEPDYQTWMVRRISQQVRRGNRGEPTFRETTAKLPISSLNKETEVIVLRDLPKRKAEAQTEDEEWWHEEDGLEAAEPTPSLTAKDIESFTDKRKQRLSQSEVNASIENSRLGEDEYIVTEAQYDAKVDELVRAYSADQLRKYKSSHSRPFAASKLRPSNPGRTVSDSASRQDVDATPWTPLDGQKQTSGDQRSSKKSPVTKRQVAEDILRECWGVQADSDTIILGQVNIYLLPEQLNLWLNSTTHALEALLPAGPFYRNSRLQLYPTVRTINIKGPQAEVESMLATIREAFGKSARTTIELDGKLLGSSVPDLANIYTPWRLGHTMSLINTYAEYDGDKKSIKLSSFNKNDLDDAFRVLVSLLPLPSRNTLSNVSLIEDTDHCYITPNVNTKSLSYRHRFTQLGRLVGTVGKKESQDAASQPHSVANQESIVKKVLMQLPPRLAQVPADVSNSRHKYRSYWQRSAEQIPWRARIGLILQSTSIPSPVDLKPSSASESQHEENKTSIFMPSFPSHLGALSELRSVGKTPSYLPTGQSLLRRYSIRPPVQLIAKLIPSPFTEAGTLASGALPTVELKFQEERPKLGEVVHMSEEEVERQKPELRFRGMQAVIDEDVVEVSLPHWPADLRLERKTVLRSHYADGDAAIARFINTVLDSEKSKEGSIRAPQQLALRMPSWTIKLPRLESACTEEERLAIKNLRRKVYRSHQENEYRYLFAGFEYRENRVIDPAQEWLKEGVYFPPNQVLKVTQVEGGLTGGKRMQASIVPKIAVHTESTEKVAGIRTVIPMPAIFRDTDGGAEKRGYSGGERDLIRASLSVMELIAKVQNGEIRVTAGIPRVRIHTIEHVLILYGLSVPEALPLVPIGSVTRPE
ncbi:mitochondrial inner-membrane-bound regulator-domain-containing protein [Delphinella strobiligena]|nr:mitochondrial inner-membrane-bound regulator-domain-containing protein [Delphinella strobiligena]